MAPSGEYAGQIKLQAANSISLPHTHGAKLLHSPTRTQTHRQTFKNNPTDGRGASDRRALPACQVSSKSDLKSLRYRAKSPKSGPNPDPGSGSGSKVNQFVLGLNRTRKQNFSQIRPAVSELCWSQTDRQTDRHTDRQIRRKHNLLGGGN